MKKKHIRKYLRSTEDKLEEVQQPVEVQQSQEEVQQPVDDNGNYVQINPETGQPLQACDHLPSGIYMGDGSDYKNEPGW